MIFNPVVTHGSDAAETVTGTINNIVTQLYYSDGTGEYKITLDGSIEVLKNSFIFFG